MLKNAIKTKTRKNKKMCQKCILTRFAHPKSFSERKCLFIFASGYPTKF